MEFSHSYTWLRGGNRVQDMLKSYLLLFCSIGLEAKMWRAFPFPGNKQQGGRSVIAHRNGLDGLQTNPRATVPLRLGCTVSSLQPANTLPANSSVHVSTLPWSGKAAKSVLWAGHGASLWNPALPARIPAADGARGTVYTVPARAGLGL